MQHPEREVADVVEDEEQEEEAAPPIVREA